MNTYKSYHNEYNIVKEVFKEMEIFSPKKEEKDVISIRLPSTLLKRLDEEAGKTDLSRNEFINQCILFALDHLKEEPKES